MQGELIRDFTYRVVRSQRKTMSLEVRRDGEVLVRAPLNMPEVRIRRFVNQKKDWILKNLNRTMDKTAEGRAVPKLSEDERNACKKKAGEILAERVDYYGKLMGAEYHRITIREQKTRWGSCSTSRNLNFNWKLVLAPPEVLDYVVVHELCHLKEMNHSPKFWEEVEKFMPDYREKRKWLKDNGWMLMEA